MPMRRIYALKEKRQGDAVHSCHIEIMNSVYSPVNLTKILLHKKTWRYPVCLSFAVYCLIVTETC